jgi:hypothetical protein
MPEEDRGFEGSLPDAFERLPFRQPVGEGSVEETMPCDYWESEFVSYFAHEYPDQFRSAENPLEVAKTMLLPSA